MMNTTTLGFIYALLAAAGFALWNIFMQRSFEKGAPNWTALFTLSASLVTVSLPVVLGGMWLGKLRVLHPMGLAWFVGGGLMTASIAPTFTGMATQRVGAAQTTALRLLDPMFAFVIGLLLLGEQLVWSAVGGVLLIMAALGLLQLEKGQQSSEAAKKSMGGLLFAITASLLFTVGTSMRKVGLGTVPFAPLSALFEGIAGMAVILPHLALTRKFGELPTIFRRDYLDMWWSGLGGAFGAFFMNSALELLPFPIAVALRNTSPWWALLLLPVILGSRHKPGWLTWVSTLVLTCGMLLILLR